MPTYTYECKKCRELSDITKEMKFFDRPETCGNCGRLMIRYYQQAQVVKDTYGQDKIMSAYPPLEGQKFGMPDKITGRSEMKRWLEKQNRKNNWNMVYDS